jgi:hypothetical protein
MLGLDGVPLARRHALGRPRLAWLRFGWRERRVAFDGCGRVREERAGHALVAATRQRQALLASRALVHERPQEREVVGEILEHALEIPLEADAARPRLVLPGIAPFLQLARDDLLDGLAVGEVGGATRAGADEVVLAERQARREIGRLDDRADSERRGRGEPEPVPAALDHLAERADRNPMLIVGQRHGVALHHRNGLRQALAPEPNGDGGPLAAGHGRTAHRLPIDLEEDPVGVVASQELVERRIQQRREVMADRFFQIAGIEERRQRIGHLQPHGSTARTGEPWRRDPLPRCAVPRRQVPRRRDVRLAAARFGQDFVGDEQPELDTDAGKADALAARLGAGRHVVVPSQVASLHPPPVVHHRKRGVGGARVEADARRAGVERVGGDLGQNRFFERAGVGVPEVFEQVLEVNARFAHERILPAGGRATPPRRPPAYDTHLLRRGVPGAAVV